MNKSVIISGRFWRSIKVLSVPMLESHGGNPMYALPMSHWDLPLSHGMG